MVWAIAKGILIAVAALIAAVAVWSEICYQRTRRQLRRYRRDLNLK